MGLERGARAARLWDPDTSRVLESGDVLYREDVFPATLTVKPDIQPTSATHVSLSFPSYPDSTPLPTPPTTQHQVDSPTVYTEPAEHLPPDTSEPNADELQTRSEPYPAVEPRRSERSRAPVVRYGFSATDQSSPEHDHPTYSQATKGPERNAWRQACQDEFNSLLQNNVGTLVDAPPRCEHPRGDVALGTQERRAQPNRALQGEVGGIR